jgi:hypothetical protein
MFAKKVTVMVFFSLGMKLHNVVIISFLIWPDDGRNKGPKQL